jgi:hypothetical protein
LRNHPAVAALIRDFWADFGESSPLHDLVHRLHQIPGMTDGHWRGYQQAQTLLTLADGSSLRVWKNWMGIDHVFVVSPDDRCLYAGFVGWLHSADLEQALQELQAEYAKPSTS